ncbi:hypothetical protein LOAG_13985, partial [Loa loa]
EDSKNMKNTSIIFTIHYYIIPDNKSIYEEEKYISFPECPEKLLQLSNAKSMLKGHQYYKHQSTIHLVTNIKRSPCKRTEREKERGRKRERGRGREREIERFSKMTRLVVPILEQQ